MLPQIFPIIVFALAADPTTNATSTPTNPLVLDAPNLRCSFDPQTGTLTGLQTHVGPNTRTWLAAPARTALRNESTNITAEPSPLSTIRETGGITIHFQYPSLSLKAQERWKPTPSGLSWDLTFTGDKSRIGHEVTIDLPILSPSLRVFTPSEFGLMSLDAHPTFKPEPYAVLGWDSGRCYVLPLVSVFDEGLDNALTIALPPDANIPHFQVEWIEASTLRLHLAHRGMGGGTPSPLRLLFYAHPADYRSVLRASGDDFPRYFNPPMPRGPYEGAFWYHHIQDHPDFDEMARQQVRYIWSSFWFTHLGEYLPPEKEWHPYTYAKWWSMKETMSDAKIQAFIRKMHDRGIGTFAYFNVTEYGGSGGEAGDPATANRILREQFADALIKNEKGQPIPTWEGAMAMNPGPQYALFPFLVEQVRRHLARLPDLDGLCIDRLDWASRYDYAHNDGLTMVADRPVENMARPVSRAVQEVARMAHAAGKRVYVNQFYRIEVLADVDGYCHENDYVRGLGYLSPFRPVSAWHMRRPYQDDLLQFEAQLKQRLHWAVFPQMIAHKFPISQQAPNPEAADMLELYAPLFAQLHGKKQVLLPHCISVTGPNDVNLFTNAAGHYVAPVISRTRFRSRSGGPDEEVMVTLRVPDASELRWAYVVSADDSPYRATLSRPDNALHVTLDRHVTSSMLVVGKGPEPTLDSPATAAARPPAKPPSVSHPGLPVSPAAIPISDVSSTSLMVFGTHVGASGKTSLTLDDQQVGILNSGANRLPLESSQWPKLLAKPVQLHLVAADEGTWFVPERIQLLIKLRNGKSYVAAEWASGTGPAATGTPGNVQTTLSHCDWREVIRSTARFNGTDSTTRGDWISAFGRTAAWIPLVSDTANRKGYRLQIAQGAPFTWTKATTEARVLQAPTGADRRSTCWFHPDAVLLSLTPPDKAPYRLTIYLLDYDRNGRVVVASITDTTDVLDIQKESVQGMDRGIYVTWTVTGPVTIKVRKQAGANAVVSAVFVDTP